LRQQRAAVCVEPEIGPVQFVVCVQRLDGPLKPDAAAFEGWSLIALYVVLATFTIYE